MTIEELLEISVEDLEQMTDEQLEAHCAPMFPTSRPERQKGSKKFVPSGVEVLPHGVKLEKTSYLQVLSDMVGVELPDKMKK